MNNNHFYESSIAGYALALVLHSVGFTLLYKSNRTLPNQRIVTMNLAAAEMMHCFWQILQQIMILTQFLSWVIKVGAIEALFIIMFLNQFFYINIGLIFILIIVDRFLYIWLNIKYTVYITKTKLAIAISFQWLVAAFIALTPVLLFRYKLITGNAYINKVLTIELVLDIFIVSTALLTFTYLFLKVKSFTQQTTSQQGTLTVLNVWTKLKIPGLMVITFIIFNITSTILKYIYFSLHHTPFVVDIVVTVLQIIGWWSDAVIYLLVQRRVRRLVSVDGADTVV